MELEIRRPDHIVPSYSLTGDLLSYLRCRLQYRYHNGSALPPSRPVQLWFGEFLHGTLELAFRFWQANYTNYPFPWPCTKREWNSQAPDWALNDIGRFSDIVESALRHQGKQARSTAVRESGYKRVETAINQLGPYLFPLISDVEKKLIGTRPIPESSTYLRCTNYEITGVIDVLTNITLNQVDSSNIIRNIVSNACPNLTGEYEVIVDYKGAHRPNVQDDYWFQGEWQIQTYAWLRNNQPNSNPVAAGILIYINELMPGDKEMQNLKEGILRNTTDVVPKPGSRDEQLIRMWKTGNSTEQISLDFRLKRAIRVIPITEISINEALSKFDDVVLCAEHDIITEASTGKILHAWSPDCKDEDTCSACDFRHFCPQPAGKDSADYVPDTPTAP